jgi:hypothetical protein
MHKEGVVTSTPEFRLGIEAANHREFTILIDKLDDAHNCPFRFPEINRSLRSGLKIVAEILSRVFDPPRSSS